MTREEQPHRLETPPAASDRDLVAACAAGDERAWQELVDRYRRLVYTVPLRAGLRNEDADDIFQLTFARLAEALPKLRQRAQVRAWLVTTARRASIDLLRRQRPHDPAALETLADAAPLPPATLESLEAKHIVVLALERLGEPCQRLLTLLYLGESLSYVQISERLGIPQGSIGPTRARCLDKLRDLYQAVEAGD